MRFLWIFFYKLICSREMYVVVRIFCTSKIDGNNENFVKTSREIPHLENIVRAEFKGIDKKKRLIDDISRRIWEFFKYSQLKTEGHWTQILL